VVYWFFIALAQATSVHYDNMHLPEIIHCKDLTKGRWPSKKIVIKGAWVRHTLFQRKRLLSKQANELKKDLTLNSPLLEETHQSLYAQPLLTMAECNTWKKEAKISTSKSCAFLTKLMFHWVKPLRISILSAAEASFTRAIPKWTRNTTFKTVSLHHRSC
jgi:hypothetical protein